MPRRLATAQEVASIGNQSGKCSCGMLKGERLWGECKTGQDLCAGSGFFTDVGNSPKKKPKKYNPANPKAYHAAIEDARLRIADRSNAKVWDNINATTILGLYSILHEKAYSVLPDDLASEWGIATQSVTRFTTKHFKGDFKKCVAFVRWKMVGETMNYSKAMDQGRGDYRRLIWKWLFMDRTVVDFKVAKGLR